MPTMDTEQARFIQGSEGRLFVNTELGCASNCAYCYLPSVGLKINSRQTGDRMSGTTLFTSLVSDTRFRSGSAGTMVSIGCFSECWDSRNVTDTLEFMSQLLPLGNRVQLATKREIRAAQLSRIADLGKYSNQVTAFISCATISNWMTFEAKTAPPRNRFRSFEACRAAGVQAVLYIKPLLAGISIIDTEEFGAIMRRHAVPAVVGDRFDADSTGIESPISRRLGVVEHQEARVMRAALSRFGSVFSNSTDAMLRL